MPRSAHTLRSSLVALALALSTQPLRAAEARRTTADDAANPFARAYVSLEMARNFPISFSQNRFAPGSSHPVLGYRHNLDADWLVGMDLQFKMLERRASEAERTGDEHLVLWTFSHDVYRAIRLSHPTYLLLGPRIMYLLPVRAATIPFSRDSSYATEIGGALSAMLAHHAGPKWMLTLRADRWRGTRTTRFLATEVAVGVSRALP